MAFRTRACVPNISVGLCVCLRVYLLFELRVRNAAALSVKPTVAESVHSRHSQESRVIRVEQTNLHYVHLKTALHKQLINPKCAFKSQCGFVVVVSELLCKKLHIFNANAHLFGETLLHQ